MKPKGRVIGLVVLVLFAAAVLLFLLFRNYRSGAVLVKEIETGDIVQVTVQKTADDGTGEKELGSFDLSPDEVTEFLTILGESKLKELGTRPSSINTDIRYYVLFKTSSAASKGTIKFYGDKTLVFDLTYDSREPVHGRYEIVSSGFKGFFEARS